MTKHERVNGRSEDWRFIGGTVSLSEDVSECSMTSEGCFAGRAADDAHPAGWYDF
jgi:hypothetical protein